MRVSGMTLSVEGLQRSLNLAVATVVGAPGGSVRSSLDRSGRCSGLMAAARGRRSSMARSRLEA